MSDYFIYYTESSIVCFLIFTIMLGHDVLAVDRQEKQIKYDHALIAFMLYFVSDAIWAAVVADVIRKTPFTVVLPNFLNFVFMAAITYTWLEYVLAVGKAPWRNKPVNRIRIAFPFLASAIVLAVIYLTRPELLLDSNSFPTSLYSFLLVAVPIIYIAAALIYSLRNARREKDPVERTTQLLTGLFPLVVVVGGLLQVIVLPDTPVFCFACTLLMLVFFIRSMEVQISLDSLTGLNNRGQLHHYTQQESSLFREGLRTFVAMIDVNDFKRVNDEYGHAEGDQALVLIADSIKRAAGEVGFLVFIARYGGDEFVLVMHCKDETGPEKMARELRRQIQVLSIKETIPYSLSVAYGYDELTPGRGTFAECLEQADRKSYKDKEYQKTGRASVA